MKKIIAVAAVLAAFSAHADAPKFGDLNYFLEAGKYNLTVDAYVRSEAAKIDGVRTEAEGYNFKSQVAYAFDNRLNIFAGVDYNLMVDQMTANQQDSEADGLQIPEFGVNYRLMTQDNAGFNLDLGAVARIEFQDAEVGLLGDEGNMIDPRVSAYSNPRNSLELNARLGNKWNEANEYYLLAAAKYNQSGEYDYVSPAGNTKVELDSSLDLTFGAFYQYRPVNEFMLKVGLMGTQIGEVDAKTSGTDITFDSQFNLDFTFGAKYLICKNFIGKFNYIQSSRPDFDAGLNKIDRRTHHAFGLGVDWLF
jgi:hypothetical protein